MEFGREHAGSPRRPAVRCAATTRPAGESTGVRDSLGHAPGAAVAAEHTRGDLDIEGGVWQEPLLHTAQCLIARSPWCRPAAGEAASQLRQAGGEEPQPSARSCFGRRARRGVGQRLVLSKLQAGRPGKKKSQKPGAHNAESETAANPSLEGVVEGDPPKKGPKAHQKPFFSNTLRAPSAAGQ